MSWKLHPIVTALRHNGKQARLFFLVGPTAVGKTELALFTAEALRAEILSGDAYCVYRGMDIGTAKPSSAEQLRVRHHGIDLVEPNEPFSIDRYAAYARQVVMELTKQGKPVLVAGGSGFYLKSFFAPMTDGIDVPASVVAEVARLEASGGLEALQEALRPLAGGREKTLDWKNPRRVARALERCLATGQDLASIQDAFAAQRAPFADAHKEVCLLQREPAELAARIEKRVDEMLAGGLIEEVRRLRSRGLVSNPSAAAAIGYRETLQFLDGQIASVAELREAIILHTRQLVRKQRTWFRRQIPVHRVVSAAGATPEECFPTAVC